MSLPRLKQLKGRMRSVSVKELFSSLFQTSGLEDFLTLYCSIGCKSQTSSFPLSTKITEFGVYSILYDSTNDDGVLVWGNRQFHDSLLQTT